ncbi:MAG: alpha-amylase, partial [Kamptonema sp. SIO4C4]|nr:alpha-amylase [Kamptonema sp. SIO4C4]
AQRANPNSLWWWMKRLLSVRARFKAFGRGTFELLYPENRKVLAFTRTYAGEHILVVANLSRFVQTVELDLSPFQNMIPIEIFGRTKFPVIGKDNYFLSISPHSFYWFMLQPVEDLQMPLPLSSGKLPTLEVQGKWQNVFTQKTAKTNLEAALSRYLYTCRWFRGANRTVQSTQILETIPLPYGDHEAQLTLLQVEYTEGLPQMYWIPITYGVQPEKEQCIAQIHNDNKGGYLFDAIADSEFLTIPLKLIGKKQRVKGQLGQLHALPTTMYQDMMSTGTQLEPHRYRGFQDNSSIINGVGVLAVIL